MPSKEKKHVGDQFLLKYSEKVPTDELIKVVTCQVDTRGAEIKYFIVALDCCIFKISSSISFYGESFFTIDKDKPTIEYIRGRDKGLFAQIDKFKLENQDFKITVDRYNQKPVVVKKDEEGGHMFIKMRNDPNFNTEKCTKFGRGYRRVEPIYRMTKIQGYRFIPFSDYTPEWAADIYGYDSFEDALEDIYPYQSKEIKQLRDLYLSRPRRMITSSMVPTEWQQCILDILDRPIKYDEQERDFHWFSDFKGKVGKSMLTKHILATRDDTLIISLTGKISDLIFSIKETLLTSTKIKNVLLDLPREMPEDTIKDNIFTLFGEKRFEDETLKFMESCANGMFSSTKYESANFHLEHGLKVVVLTNSLPLLPAASLDRWHIYLINDYKTLRIKDLGCEDFRPRIATREDTISFYLSQSELIAYMKEHGFRTERRKPMMYKIHDIP